MKASTIKLHQLIASLFILMTNMTTASHANADVGLRAPFPPDFPYATPEELSPHDMQMMHKKRRPPRFIPQEEDEMRNADFYDRPNKKNRNQMTPEERRDLRRQINEAGVNLYPNEPRH